jgi:hypothetical protein
MPKKLAATTSPKRTRHEAKKESKAMLDILDERLDEARFRFNAAQAKRNALKPAAATASSSTAYRVANLQKTIDECKTRFPESTQPAKSAPEAEGKTWAPGSLMRQACAMSEALRKLRAGQVGQAMSIAAERADKLPVYRIEGGAR